MKITRALTGIAIATLLTVGVVAPVAALNPIDQPGNVSCADLGLDGLKLDDMPVAGQIVSNGDLTIQITSVTNKIGEDEAYGFTFVVLAGGPVTAVLVKGGNYTTVFSNNPDNTGEFRFDSAVNPRNGRHFGISFVAFCYGGEEPGPE